MRERCPITDERMIDDCYITIEFGYGSTKDCWTYKFHPVSDKVGQAVLETIQSLAKDGVDVDDFGKDEMDDHFGVK